MMVTDFSKTRLVLLCSACFLASALISNAQENSDPLNLQEVRAGILQNVKTGLDLRPYEAMSSDGNRMVIWDHHAWECMTWDFAAKGKNVFQLKNKYTGKSFQPADKQPKPGGKVVQMAYKADDGKQLWVFEPVTAGVVRIKAHSTKLYLTISGTAANSDVILAEKSDTDKQLWKVVTDKNEKASIGNEKGDITHFRLSVS